jgi:hypothetical protein
MLYLANGYHLECLLKPNQAPFEHSICITSCPQAFELQATKYREFKGKLENLGKQILKIDNYDLIKIKTVHTSGKTRAGTLMTSYLQLKLLPTLRLEDSRVTNV